MSCSSIVQYYVNQDLSGEDILSLTGKKPIVYQELSKIKNINQLLGPEKFSIILYEVNSSSEGHWTCLYRQENNNMLTWFDSYGLDVDTEDLYAPTNAKLPKYLTQLIQKSGEKYQFNKIDYQSKNQASTCGRWASCSAKIFRYMDLDQVDIFLKNNDSAWLNPDRIVTMLTIYTLNQISQFFNK
jgi:hypothetical protein